MLTLTLRAAHGMPPETRMLTQGTLSIGRASGNDWVLPDPDRHLSKTHCVIVAAGGRIVLTDLSTNGVFVNGARDRVPRDGQVVLTDGDEIRLGEYIIAVAEEAAAPLAAHAPRAPGGLGRPDPLGDLTPDPLGGDPFEDGFGAQSGFVHPIAAPTPVLRGNDPFDLLDEKRGVHEEPDADLFRGSVPLDQWQGASQADNADAPLHAFEAPRAFAPTDFDSLDIDALLGDEPPLPGAAHTAPQAAPPPVARPAAMQPDPFAPKAALPPDPFAPKAALPPDPFADDMTGNIPPGALPSRVASAPPPTSADPFAEPDLPPPPRPVPQAAPPPAMQAAPPADAARLLAAFLEGAGVPDLPPSADPEAALREAGAVFRAMVEGVRQVLIARAAIKNEFRMEQTMLRARDNNPLKFSVSDEDATAALLQARRAGYKAPLAATQEAFDDIRSHEMAVMAGVQTALLGLLRRFEPEALEKRLQPGLLGNLLPAARKARTWELFCTTYKEIAREAEDDFQAVFGRSFARAYDAQVQKL